jgi:hypothetical protein
LSTADRLTDNADLVDPELPELLAGVAVRGAGGAGGAGGRGTDDVELMEPGPLAGEGGATGTAESSDGEATGTCVGSDGPVPLSTARPGAGDGDALPSVVLLLWACRTAGAVFFLASCGETGTIDTLLPRRVPGKEPAGCGRAAKTFLMTSPDRPGSWAVSDAVHPSMLRQTCQRHDHRR